MAEADAIIKKYDPDIAQEVSKAGGRPAAPIQWQEIYRLELAILKLESFEGLCRKVTILRQEYNEIASSDERVKYAECNPPKVESDKSDDEKYVKLLRADAVKLQEELNWAYTVIWIQEEYRGKLTEQVAVVTLLVALVSGLFGIYGYKWDMTSELILPDVILAGILGSCVSTLQRIQAMKLDSNSDLNLIELERGKWSIYCSALLGGIFAAVLCCLFAGGFLEGSFFPKFNGDGNLLFGCFSLECNDGAKLFIWSFIAGFAERLVPDKLDKLASSANKDEK